MSPALIPLIVVCSLITIITQHSQRRKWVYLFKPLTILLIVLVVLVSDSPFGFYKIAITIGLLFSLAGDVFLMLPGNKFLQGLISFLIAHVCYITAFSFQTGWTFSPWSLAILLIGFGLMNQVLPRSGKMRLPALIYAMVICAMLWRAFEFWLSASDAKSLLALIGATLFATSDSALAYNRFVKNFRAAHVVVLSTYYAAQWLIASSV